MDSLHQTIDGISRAMAALGCLEIVERERETDRDRE